MTLSAEGVGWGGHPTTTKRAAGEKPGQVTRSSGSSTELKGKLGGVDMDSICLQPLEPRAPAAYSIISV